MKANMDGKEIDLVLHSFGLALVLLDTLWAQIGSLR